MPTIGDIVVDSIENIGANKLTAPPLTLTEL